MSEFSSSRSTDKNEFLDKAKAARIERQKEKESNNAAVTIQSVVRGFLARRRLKHSLYQLFDEHIPELNDDLTLTKSPPDIHDVFRAIRGFLFVMDSRGDRARFDRMCRYILATMLLPKFDTKVSYVAIGCSKDSIAWIHQLKQILCRCMFYMKALRPELAQDHKSLMLYLNMLLTFTSTATWKVQEPLRPVMQKLCGNVLNHLIARGLFATLQAVLIKGLCRSQPSLKKAELAAVVSISSRYVTHSQHNDTSINLLLVHILSVPSLLHYVSLLAPESLKLLAAPSITTSHANSKNPSMLSSILDFLLHEQNSKILFNVLEGNYSLCLLANLVQLASLHIELLRSRTLDFVTVVQRLLQSCQNYVGSKQTSMSRVFHPILGWFAQHEDSGLNESLGAVRQQLSLLWSSEIVMLLFESLIAINQKLQSQQPEKQPAASVPNSDQSDYSSRNVLRRAIDRASSAITKTTEVVYLTNSSSTAGALRMGSPEVAIVSMICTMYTTALSTLTQMRLEILTGLCYHDVILPNLWQFITSVGPRSCLLAYLDHLALSTKTCAPEFQLLILFCDCAGHLITILDDIEIYEKQRPFSLGDFAAISSFLNNFVFRLIWNNLIDLKNINNNALLNSTHTLLMILYKRDCRRSYVPKDDHWLIKELKIGAFMKDLESGKRAAQLLLQKVPHIIPHKERVLLFRKNVLSEKAALGLTDSSSSSAPHSTLITVHRQRIVEDGFQQLAALPSPALKGTIRVKFISELGLDEAGIDQDGVFKEFLEETIKKVFDPSLNLFRVTSEQRLYPSPTSFVHENHLSLFEFVGKVLGKAIYEGIVVDVPFASFFLGQVLGQQQGLLYSSIDELSSLDSELYKSLTYIKHYDGDVSDLGLTFSVDEDYMGKLVTHELLSGGRFITVTKATRINYIHLMAHFRMHTQIKEQTAAFIKGFRTIVNPEWLNIFSPLEFQRLISGDTTPIDLNDLRRHTKYYGGFHNNHRVISWLWDILENDFTPEEHSQFLKFVTSCSKPPLLGFVNLEPPFSIRCVEVGDDQDVGDTVGSVLRGFFTIRRKDPINRLPTSSTCFNLLKLPNYQKKSTLREKLRYAIMNNTGFELS